jgi:hypothetical protein
MAFTVKETVARWNDVMAFFKSRGKEYLGGLNVLTVNGDSSLWVAEDKTEWLYLKGFVAQGDPKTIFHLSCNIVGGIWSQLHATQETNNLHLGSWAISEVDLSSDLFEQTGQELMLLSSKSIKVNGSHKNMKESKQETLKKEKIKSKGGKLYSLKHDVQIIVNAMKSELEFDWTT